MTDNNAKSDIQNNSGPDNESKTNEGPKKTVRRVRKKKTVPESPKFKYQKYIIYAIIALLFISTMFGGMPGAKEISREEFVDKYLSQNKVEQLVVVNKSDVEIYLKKTDEDFSEKKDIFDKMVSNSGMSPDYKFTIGDAGKFEEFIYKAKEEYNADCIIKFDNSRTSFWENFLGYLPIIVLIGIWIYFFRRMGKNSGGGGIGGGMNIFNMGKSKAKEFNADHSNEKVTFKNVAGLNEVKVEINELVDFLKNSSKYTKLGAKIPRGALLVGPPGTGKTLLAKAVAGEAGVPFFSISGSDFVEMFVGVGASRVRDLFAQAKAKAPCIVFIDEIDAIGRARGNNPNMGSNDERENTLNSLLTEMDGFQGNTGVIVLAATNRVDMLDKALKRAGRFDRQIQVDLPDLNERREIFGVHVKPLKLEKGLELEFFAKQTPGFSGADIANVCNEAALIAARNKKPAVGRQDFLDAVDRIIGGLEKKNKIISTDEKKGVAYHEAGHATISWMVEHAHPLVKVTIVPRGNALGAAWYLPKERQLTRTEELLDELCALLGGRAAEDVVFGKVSTGALNDLERATKMVYSMVSFYGMSDKIGNVSFFDSQNGGQYGFTKPYSEKTAEDIDNEVKRIIEEQYSRAKEIISTNIETFTKLADKLLEEEVIFSDDLEKIFGKKLTDKKEEIRNA
jgi:cell division protease FtsH